MAAKARNTNRTKRLTETLTGPSTDYDAYRYSVAIASGKPDRTESQGNRMNGMRRPSPPVSWPGQASCAKTFQSKEIGEISSRGVTASRIQSGKHIVFSSMNHLEQGGRSWDILVVCGSRAPPCSASASAISTTQGTEGTEIEFIETSLCPLCLCGGKENAFSGCCLSSGPVSSGCHYAHYR